MDNTIKETQNEYIAKEFTINPVFVAIFKFTTLFIICYVGGKIEHNEVDNLNRLLTSIMQSFMLIVIFSIIKECFNDFIKEVKEIMKDK